MFGSYQAVFCSFVSLMCVADCCITQALQKVSKQYFSTQPIEARRSNVEVSPTVHVHTKLSSKINGINQ